MTGLQFLLIDDFYTLLPGDESIGELGSAGMPMPFIGVQPEPKYCCIMDSLHASHSRSAVPNPDREMMIKRVISPKIINDHLLILTPCICIDVYLDFACYLGYCQLSGVLPVI